MLQVEKVGPVVQGAHLVPAELILLFSGNHEVLAEAMYDLHHNHLPQGLRSMAREEFFQGSLISFKTSGNLALKYLCCLNHIPVVSSPLCAPCSGTGCPRNLLPDLIWSPCNENMLNCLFPLSSAALGVM